MQITIVAQNGEQEDLIPVADVSPTQTLAEFKNMIEPFIGIPAGQQQLTFHDRQLIDHSLTLEAAGIGNEDYIYVLREQPRPKRKAKDQNQVDDPEKLRNQMLANNDFYSRIKKDYPELAEAVEDPVRFGEILDRLRAPAREREEAKRRLLQRINDDPLDVEAQKEIEEMIRRERVQENRDEALESSPELFGHITMLYIPIEVNGVLVKALVDSGAQTTVMSPACAEQCNILRLIDKEFSGIARGAGTAAILGRVHSAPIQIGKNFLVCSFTVMEGKDINMLLGLDMLKRYQASIDLEKNVLRIAGDEVAFLPESEIPKEGIGASKTTVEGPAAGKVDGESGAILVPESHTDQPSGSAAASTRQHWQDKQGSGAQAPSGAAGSSTGTGPSANTGHVDGDKVQQLVQMGFSEPQARQALELAQGNVDLAASILFGA